MILFERRISKGIGILSIGLLLAFQSTTISYAQAPDKEVQLLEWEKLQPLPVPAGLVGMYAGTSNGVLILTGGVSRTQSGETETWNDRIYVLPDKSGAWQLAYQKLPQPMAHGVSVSHTNGETGESKLICVGGLNEAGALDQVLLISWNGERVILEHGPPLPKPIAFATGDILLGKLYVAGGKQGMETGQPTANFWGLYIGNELEDWSWQDLDTWPGPARFSALSATQYGGFYLFGGQTDKENLSDVYRFIPGLDDRPGNWTKIDGPNGEATFPLTPVLPLGQSHIAILGRSERAGGPRATPGTTQPIRTYHTVTGAWTVQGQVPEDVSMADAMATPWLDGFAVAGGVNATGIVSTQVRFARLSTPKAPFSWPDWVVLIFYLVLLVWMGYYFSRREKDTDDYFLGGKRVPWWAAGISIIGTGLSAISYMGTPAVVFETDLVRMVGGFMYLPGGILAIYFFLPFFRRLKITTAYEYLEFRFNVAVRMFVSGIYIASQFGRMAVVVYLPALALSAVTGIDVNLCIALMGFLAILYTVLGGIEAVIWTDVVQVVILYFGAFICLGVIIWKVGSFSELIDIGGSGNKFRLANFTWDYTVMAFYIMFIGNLVNVFVGYGSDQSYVQRYLTTPTERDAAKGILLSGVIPFLSSPLFALFGVGLWVFYKTHPEMLLPGNNDAIVPTFIAQILPPGISGLVIAGIFAASMSSLDSGMHSAATAYITDFHRRIWKNLSDGRALKLARVATVLFGLLGTGFSFVLVQAKELPIFDAWAVLINLIVGGYGGAFLLGVFTRKANGWGTFIGIFFGALVPFLVMTYTHITFYAWGLIAVISCLVTGYIASLLIPSEKKDLTGLTIHTIKEIENRVQG